MVLGLAWWGGATPFFYFFGGGCSLVVIKCVAGLGVGLGGFCDAFFGDPVVGGVPKGLVVVDEDELGGLVGEVEVFGYGVG